MQKISAWYMVHDVIHYEEELLSVCVALVAC